MNKIIQLITILLSIHQYVSLTLGSEAQASQYQPQEYFNDLQDVQIKFKSGIEAITSEIDQIQQILDDKEIKDS